jgi:uncharacterized protein (TIGR02246 family)
MSAHAAIKENYTAMEEAFHKGNARAIALMYTEDAEWLIPEVPAIRGREAIAQAWQRVIGSGGNRVRIEIDEVQENGDWAYEVGRFTVSGPYQNVLNAGKYIVIWKREASGAWKTHRDIFNWDIPPTQPSIS